MPDETESFSIYFALAQGQKADVETVSHALLEFAAAVKEAAFFIDPQFDLRIELAEGKDSSLNLRTIFRAVSAKAPNKNVLYGVAWGATAWLGGQVGADFYDNSSLHTFIQGHSDGQISEEDIKKIADQVAKAANAEPVRSHVQQFYRTLDRDSAITGVGATLTPNVRPPLIVPQSQFKELSGVDQVLEITQQTREKITHETVVLVSPVLLESNRKWRFRSGTGEFGAAIDDQKFLLDILTGRRNVPMKAGIQFDVELKTIEERTDDGLWKPVDRHILHVIEMREPSHQTLMDFSASHENDGGNVDK